MAFNGRGGNYDIKKYYNTPIYRSWYNMKTRCSNNKIKYFARYGGRGITFCDRWKLFKNFLDDMGSSYESGLSLDRIDNNKGYYKENCRWATRKEQSNNTRNIENAKKYNINGVLFTIKQLSEVFKIKRTTLDMRLNNYGWTLEKSLTTK